MTDRFRTVIEQQFPRGTSMWEVLTQVVSYATDLLSSRPGLVTVSEFRASDPHASTVHRSTIGELQAALRSNYIAVETVLVDLSVADDQTVAWEKSVEVEFRVWFSGRSIERRVDVTITSVDNVVLHGLSAQIDAELRLLSSRAAKQHVPDVEAPSAAPATRRGEVNGPAHGGEDTRSWLVRTWRDHTATFAATTIGGLLVVALAVWLGLSH